MLTINNKITVNQVVSILLEFSQIFETEEHDFTNKQKHVIETLSLMTGQELMNLAKSILDENTIKVSTKIDMPELVKKIERTIHYQNKKINEKDKLQWLVKHNGTNALIFKICPTINERDIKLIRESLGLKMTKGRKRMPDIEDRLSIKNRFLCLKKNINDYFEIYQTLHVEFNTYDLGSIHATIIGDEK